MSSLRAPEVPPRSPQAPGRGVPDDGRVGLYVHVPFCERVCPYCDFAVVAARRLVPEQEERYVAALRSELERRAPAYAERPLASLYLGGGTPSLLRPDSLARIVAAAQAVFPARPETEVTLEVNPSTLERERLPAFRAAGVSRLSIGVQSFDDTVLRRLGRAHKAEEAHRTLAAARDAGFDNVSLDLLFAGPGSSLPQLGRDLDAALAFAPEHLSSYELSVEPGTPFAAAAARGRLPRPEEELVLAMMEALERRLEGAGLARYEISSYARPGFESVHNRRYWERTPVLGIGVGAWSTEPPGEAAPHGARRANPRDLASYLARVEAGRPAAGEVERLDARTARGEAVFLALRRVAGLEAARFAAEFGAPPRAFFAREIEELTGVGLLRETRAQDLALTPRGRRLSDSVFARFV